MKQVFDLTNRLLVPSNIDSIYGFLAMYTLDHDDVTDKRFDIPAGTTFVSEELLLILIEEMNKSTMRCHSCHRFKTISDPFPGD
jgi:hypothetical protein